MIRLQDKTPEVYCSESRDFQLFCRLYDCVVNGIKFDIDTIPDILDAMTCRSSMLQLLQTKVGFFTNKQLTDDALRYVLTAFPMMVKNKGSLKAVQQAVNVFFKVNGIRSEVQIWSVSEPTQIYDTWVDDHTIIIGINSTIKDVSLLEEIFRYILPTGFGYYFYFYNQVDEITSYLQEHKATLLFTSDNINSQVRAIKDIYEGNDDAINRLLNGIDTMSIASIDTQIKTLNGTYTAGDRNKFLGRFSSLDEVPSDNLQYDDTVLIDTEEYLYRSGWHSVRFRGAEENLDLVVNASEYDIVCIPSITSYYYKKDNSYVSLKYRGVFNSVQDVISPETNDLVRCGSSFYIRTETSWEEYTETYKVYTLPDVESAMSGVIYLVDTYTYFMYNNNRWNVTDVPVYMLTVEEV